MGEKMLCQLKKRVGQADNTGQSFSMTGRPNTQNFNISITQHYLWHIHYGTIIAPEEDCPNAYLEERIILSRFLHDLNNWNLLQ